jgi:hypothetical protein
LQIKIIENNSPAIRNFFRRSHLGHHSLLTPVLSNQRPSGQSGTAVVNEKYFRFERVLGSGSSVGCGYSERFVFSTSTIVPSSLSWSSYFKFHLPIFDTLSDQKETFQTSDSGTQVAYGTPPLKVLF